MTSLSGWMPIRIYWHNSQPLVDWCYLGDERFTDPFFDQTIERALRKPFALLFRHQTSIDSLQEVADSELSVRPTGFIFHMSRCGSTLVSQMLASLPQNIVISEAGPIDSILRANWHDPRVTDDMRIAWLKGLLAVYGRKRKGGEEYLYVKFDSWHTLDLGLIRRAFPEVPWIFLYRDPVEVMASHRRMMGAQMVPGNLHPALFNLDYAALAGMSLEEYCARVLQSIGEAALERVDEAARLYNYRQLPDAVWSDLPGHFQVQYTATEIARMQDVTRFDAKSPSLPFTDDTAAKNREVTVEMRKLAEERLMPVYRKLESARQPAQADWVGRS